jgi:HSP20 family protein
MFITKWRPFEAVQDNFNSLNVHDRDIDFFFSDLLERDNIKTGWAPKIDVFDDKDKVTVKAELPGLKKEDIKISLTENILSIEGERKLENEKKKDNYYRIERSYGAFTRSVCLPAEVKVDETKASYNDGVLEIYLPKVEEEEPKQIKIDLN